MWQMRSSIVTVGPTSQHVMSSNLSQIGVVSLKLSCQFSHSLFFNVAEFNSQIFNNQSINIRTKIFYSRLDFCVFTLLIQLLLLKP